MAHAGFKTVPDNLSESSEHYMHSPLGKIYEGHPRSLMGGSTTSAWIMDKGYYFGEKIGVYLCEDYLTNDIDDTCITNLAL